MIAQMESKENNSIGKKGKKNNLKFKMYGGEYSKFYLFQNLNQ